MGFCSKCGNKVAEGDPYCSACGTKLEQIVVTEDRNRTLYEVLEVPRTATQRQIEESYHLLSQRYHPDLNPSPDAAIRMSEIDSAYAVLGNSWNRIGYDKTLEIQEKVGEPEGTDPVTYAESFARQVRCQRCGRFDHTLRIVAFPWVISVIVISNKTYESGIFCNHCRSLNSRIYAAGSLLFGWWGVPWGPIWTIGALIANFRGGKMPEEENRDLLSQLAWTNAVLGRIGEAKAAIRDSLQFGVSEPTQRFKEELDRTYPTVQPTVAAGFRFWGC